MKNYTIVKVVYIIIYIYKEKQTKKNFLNIKQTLKFFVGHDYVLYLKIHKKKLI